MFLVIIVLGNQIKNVVRVPMDIIMMHQMLIIQIMDVMKIVKVINIKIIKQIHANPAQVIVLYVQVLITKIVNNVNQDFISIG